MARLRVRSGKKGKSYQVVYKDPATGKERCKSFTLRKTAVDFQENVGIEGLVHERDTITVARAVDRWLAVCETVGRRGREPVEKSTLVKYHEHAKFIKKHQGGHKLTRVTPQLGQEFVEVLLQTFSRKYAKKFLTSYKAVMNQAIADAHLRINPLEMVGIHISSRVTGGDKAAIPSIDDVGRLLRKADKMANHANATIAIAWKRYRPLFYTLAFSGMRPTELRGLPWRDVNFAAGTITVSQDANYDGSLGLPKSAAGYRTISMPDDVMTILKTWKLACPISDWDLVFPNYAGKVESHHNITNRGWYILLKETGLVDVDASGRQIYRYPLKSLRHVRASLEIAAGAGAKEVQTLMGHSSIKVTFDVYGHLFPDHAKERTARANRILGSVMEDNGQKTGKAKNLSLKTVS